jgi:hypothetical protein
VPGRRLLGAPWNSVPASTTRRGRRYEQNPVTTITIPTVTLNNGVDMPLLGFGVFQIPPEQTEQVVVEALAAGYRSLDTAAAYRNEEALGRAITASGIPREEFFITTKVWVQDPGEDNTKRAFEASLRRLQLEYVDLYLIHQPFGDYYSEWRAMQELNRQGLIRAIGVANFYPDRLVDLIDSQRDHPGRQPGRVPPVLPAGGRPGAGARAGRADRVVGAVRRRAQQPLQRRDPLGNRRRPRKVNRPGRPSLADPAQCGRHPQVGPARAHAREHRRLRLRTDR